MCAWGKAASRNLDEVKHLCHWAHGSWLHFFRQNRAFEAGYQKYSRVGDGAGEGAAQVGGGEGAEEEEACGGGVVGGVGKGVWRGTGGAGGQS